MVWRSMADYLDVYSIPKGEHVLRFDFEEAGGLHEPWFSPSGRAVAGKVKWEPAFLDLSDAIKESR